MPQNFWREVWILAGITLGSLLLGALTDRYFIVAAFGFGFYIIVNLRHLGALALWLTDRKRRELPEAEGLWGDVFNAARKLVRESERREAELVDEINRLQNAATAMPDAVIVLRERDEIDWANATARRLLGIDFPRDAGLRFGNLLRDPAFAAYLAAGNFAEPLDIESPLSEDIKLSLRIIPYGANQKLLMVRDNTRLARLEQMRRVFVANVSHELRTPLTVLAGYVETLRDIEHLQPAELQKHLATMQEQTGRMQRLVDDLLMLSRLETAPPRSHEEEVDVAALLAGIRDQAGLLSGEAHHRITLNAEPGLRLRGSREELHSAFANLVHNAVRYTPSGGQIDIGWRRDGHGGAVFSVRDNGEGIAPEHLPHLTERFYRVDTARSRASGGTGLGLSIVKHVLLRHDAELEIESTVGLGSTFRCVFPEQRVVATSPSVVASAN